MRHELQWNFVFLSVKIRKKTVLGGFAIIEKGGYEAVRLDCILDGIKHAAL